MNRTLATTLPEDEPRPLPPRSLPPRSGARRSWLAVVAEFLASWRFPACALAVLLAQELALLALLVAPAAGDGALGFADEFRMWCFGWDPATHRLQWVAVFTTLTAPLLLGALLLTTWWEPLAAAARSSRGCFVRWCTAWGAVGAAGTLGVAALAGGTPSTGELPFPAEALRIAVPLQPFELIDHEGQPLRSRDLTGRVVLLTAVYSTCGFT